MEFGSLLVFSSFDEKTMNRKLFFLQFLMIAVASCGIDDLGAGSHSNEDGIWYGPSVPDPENVCFTTAYDYPDGYNWRSDPQSAAVRCMLTLFADDIPVLKIPAGDAYCVSMKPEHHRVIKGDLYTDYSDSLGTVIKKNGKEVLRYPDSETIVNMLVSDGTIHTLGVNGTGHGFVYRIDGEKAVERAEGTLYNHLVLSRDSVCFCFSCPVSDSGGIKQRYYAVSSGKVRLIDVNPLTDKVWDMMVSDGYLCMISTFKGSSVLHCSKGNRSQSISAGMQNQIISVEFIDAGKLCVQVIVKNEKGLTYMLSPGLRGSFKYETGKALSAVYADDDGCYAAVNPSSGEVGRIYSGTSYVEIPQGYGIMGVSPMRKRDSVLIVGLSSLDGGRPVLWKNGVSDTLNVNGYIANMACDR